jgi:hypothetical protein
MKLASTIWKNDKHLNNQRDSLVVYASIEALNASVNDMEEYPAWNFNSLKVEDNL